MAATIQINRGVFASLPTLADGEFYWATDTNQLFIGDPGGNREIEAVKNNYAATVAPTVNEDSGDGYSVGSKWIDVTGDDAYICVDATATAAVWVQMNGGGGVTAHSALSGLTSGDDHTQYALLAGRSGGQTLKGGTASGNSLLLSSTNHATKGFIQIQDVMHLEPNSTPATPLSGGRIFHDGGTDKIKMVGPSGNVEDMTHGTQSANRVFAGPTSGSAAIPAFRALVSADMPAMVGAQAYNSANISHTTSGSWQSVTLNSERFDTNTFHSTSSNTQRLTIPSGMGGKYLITASIVFDANATGSRGVSIDKNGMFGVGTNLAFDIRAAAPGGGDTTVCKTTCIAELAAGDYVEMSSFQNRGGALDMLALFQMPELTAVFLGT